MASPQGGAYQTGAVDDAVSQWFGLCPVDISEDISEGEPGTHLTRGALYTSQKGSLVHIAEGEPARLPF